MAFEEATSISVKHPLFENGAFTKVPFFFLFFFFSKKGGNCCYCVQRTCGEKVLRVNLYISGVCAWNT